MSYIAGDLPASRRGRPVPVHISVQYGPWRRGGRENEGAFHCRWIVMSSSPLSTQEYEEAVRKAAQDVGEVGAEAAEALVSVSHAMDPPASLSASAAKRSRRRGRRGRGKSCLQIS